MKTKLIGKICLIVFLFAFLSFALINSANSKDKIVGKDFEINSKNLESVYKIQEEFNYKHMVVVDLETNKKVLIHNLGDIKNEKR